MAETIILDAGHGGRDPGAVFEGRQEKDDALRMALAVGEILEKNGLDVMYTRTEDVYDTPYEKAMMANQADADYFVSFHRNAAANPGSGAGVESLVFAEGGVPGRIGTEVNEQLEQLGFANRGITERPGLVVLRRTKMPAVLLELGFIDNPRDNELFDEKFDEIAQGIAQGILNALGIENTAGGEGKPVYKVQVGAYRAGNLANQLLTQLLAEGYPAYIVRQDGLYKVQVGAFEDVDPAAEMERTLRRAGYNTFLTK